jgi:hypothetical protein
VRARVVSLGRVSSVLAGDESTGGQVVEREEFAALLFGDDGPGVEAVGDIGGWSRGVVPES